jgi:hypothetical protein
MRSGGEWRPPMTRNVWSVTKKEGDIRERHRLTNSYNYIVDKNADPRNEGRFGRK